MNSSAGVRPGTSDRVRQAVAALGYVPSSHARALKGKPSNSIALIISDVANPFFAALTRGVEDFAQGEGFSLVLCNADRGKAKQRQYLERLLAGGIKGMIIAPATNAINDLKRLPRRGVALVIVDWRYPLPDADNVYTDSIAGARQLADHLIRLGHRRIGMISGPRGDMTAEDRVTGYRLALAGAGLSEDTHLVRFGQFSQESGQRHCRRLLALDPRPSAIIAANNRIAAGAYEAINTLGLSIPRDISLVGFDDIPFVPALASRLTVFAQPDYEMGRIAAQLLFERLQGKRRPEERREVILEGKLVVRASSGPPAPVGAGTSAASIVSSRVSAL